MFCLLVVVASLGIGQVMGQCEGFDEALDWTYVGTSGREDNHPFWNDVSGGVCGVTGDMSTNQSPINIVTDDVVVDQALANRITFTGGYFARMPGELENTGRTFEFTPGAEAPPAFISGGPLGCKEYRFAQFHFHWGRTVTTGSEHTVNGFQHAGELHMVHYNTAYSSLAEAANHPDGLAVLGFFIEHEPNFGRNNLLRDLFVPFRPVENRACGTHLDFTAKLADILCSVESLDKYYTYPGSLTTPNCNEVVTWIVFQDTIMANGDRELQIIRRLEALQGGRLVDNFRAIQATNGRVVSMPPMAA